MSQIDGAMGPHGTLKATVHRGGTAWSLSTPFGRIILSRDRGEGFRLGRQVYVSHLSAVHRRNGTVYETYDFGSGLVTNAGVNMWANDYTLATATLKQMNYHGTGTGTTAATVGDTALQTAIGTTATAGTQASAPPNKYQTSATITYGAAYAVTEWGLFMAATLSGAANSTGTSTGVALTTLTDSGKTWTVNQWAGYTVTTGSVMAFILSNTATVLTHTGWYTPSTNVLAANPATGAYTIVPTMLDHRVALAINTQAAGTDTITWNYQLALVSGG